MQNGRSSGPLLASNILALVPDIGTVEAHAGIESVFSTVCGVFEGKCTRKGI